MRLQLFETLTWYAVRVRPQGEFIAEEILHRNGHYVYLPLDWRYRRLGRYRKQRELAKFPLLIGYIFVGFEPGPIHWFSLFRFRFVQSVVGHNGTPFAIPGTALTFLEQTERAHAPSAVPNSHRTFNVGDMVTYLDQCLKVEEIRGPAARVMFPMFDTIHETWVPMWKLEVAS